ncbi:MAG: hypothetical protein BroJett021_20810 [Chloroflexota bacterium]|nr:DUF4160 domain-containing protein [Caldilinea sp.]GIK73093.1 MAG: hypothetical protein BroJett021_20810 [Chloroflexota bacterium]
MAEIARFLGIIISLYVETGVRHHPPHFHVRYNEYKAVYGIRPAVVDELRARAQTWSERVAVR